MDTLVELGTWVTQHESLLSGLAAMIVLAGVLLSPLGMGLRRLVLRRARERDAERASPAATAPRRLELSDLAAPSPFETKFADRSGTRIAYNERGEGPITIVYVPGLISHLHLLHNLPGTGGNLEALSRFARLILFDKRGQGQSHAALRTTIDEHAEDIGAVMDAAGVERAVLLSFSEGGPLCVQFAHSHPERVQGLVLVGSTPRWALADDYPIGAPRKTLESLGRIWGTGVMRERMFPSMTRDMIDDDTYCAMERLVGNRHSIAQVAQMMIDTDVRPLLPEVRVPALIIHFSSDLAVPIQQGRALAEGLPNSEFLEVNSADHGNVANVPEAMVRIREFCERVSD